MAGEPASREVSRILKSGKAEMNRLLPLVYENLRRIAARRMAAERKDHTLQVTALVHEAYLRLVGEDLAWESKAHFYAAAGQAMRMILLDHAKGKRRKKRGGGRRPLPLDLVDLATREDATEILAVDEAFRRLEERDPRMAEIVRLRFFAGLSERETAAALGTSERTVRREWTIARAFLQRELEG